LGAEVHFLTKGKFKGLLEHNPHLAKIHHFDDTLSEIKSDLIAENYDYVVDLHKNLRSGQVKRWLKQKSGTFHKLNLNKWLYVNTKWNTLPKLHIVDRYFRAMAEVANDGLGLEYFISVEDRVDLGIGPYVGIVLGATYYTKRIPEVKVREMIQAIDGQVVLIGGPEERQLGDQIARDYENVYNTAGDYKIAQSASIIENSVYLITSDTGMMHIAAALNKSIGTVWGNTVPAFGMGPYLADHQDFEVENLSCRPCSKLGSKTCPRGHFKCMMDQDINAITQIANMKLQEGSS